MDEPTLEQQMADTEQLLISTVYERYGIHDEPLFELWLESFKNRDQARSEELLRQLSNFS